MKQQQQTLQTDLNKKHYLSKLWHCKHISQLINYQGALPTVFRLRENFPLRGQSLILRVTPFSTFSNEYQDKMFRLYCLFNKHNRQSLDKFPLFNPNGETNLNSAETFYKFEGYESYSLYATIWGLEEQYYLDMYEILCDQTEDISVYSLPFYMGRLN